MDGQIWFGCEEHNAHHAWNGTKLAVAGAKARRGACLRVLRWGVSLALVVSAFVSSIGVLPSAPRAAQAATFTWTQTAWSGGINTGVQPSGTTNFALRANVCAGPGAWCAGATSLRLAGNHATDNGNYYSTDLNADGWPEVVFANHPAARIHWGQPGGAYGVTYSADVASDLPAYRAVGLSVADINGDGVPEVVVANKDGSHSRIYWGQVGGTRGVTYTMDSATDLPTSGAWGVSVADLNRDGRPEVIFANHSNGSTYNINSRIYWGQAGGTYGVTYSTAAVTDLPSSGARGVNVADLNGDGRPEVILANYYDGNNYNLNSRIYWGQTGGTYGVTYGIGAVTHLSTTGASGVSAADLNDDGRPEVIFANTFNGTSYMLYGRVYWGRPGGSFGTAYSTSDKTDLPTAGGVGVSVADLNSDGRAEIIFTSFGNYSSRIYWGQVGGTYGVTYTVAHTALVQTMAARGVSIADLNNDGRPELIFSQQRDPNTDNYLIDSRIYWGQTGGPYGVTYTTTQVISLPTASVIGNAASFKLRGTGDGIHSEPSARYGVAWTQYGYLESSVIDSGANGTAWTQVVANAAITAHTGITVFIAANDNLATVQSSPSWQQVGALTNGANALSLSGVSGRYARYRVVLWSGRQTDASPALHDITLTAQTVPTQSGFNKTAPANGATGVATSPTLSWTTVADATSYQVCYDTTVNGSCNGTWQSVGNVSSTALSGLTAGTLYEWQVRACNVAGCNGGADNGAWWTFTTAMPPGAFSKTSPANGATNQPTSVTLSWDTASGTVDHYEYCVSTTPSCSSWTNVGTNTSTTHSGLNPGTLYYWQARACNSASCTQANGGSFWNFQTAAAVGGFNKLAPGNGAVNVNTNTAQLQWGAASGATEYKVCVGTAVNTCDVLGGGPGQYASVGANQFRVLSDLGLQPNTTYYWQALATNGTYTTFANGGALAFWSFTTLPNGPDAFGKLSPPFNATNVPTSNVSFSWQPSTGAVSYTLCVGAFTSDCSYSLTATATSAVLAGPLPAGATLVWQVTAHNAGGSTGADNGAWWPFTTVPNAPQAFSKLNPSDNATGQPLGVNLTWQDVPDEDYYHVCMGLVDGQCTLVNVTATANSTFYALSGLSYGTTYYWQVSACNAGGCTPANNGVWWQFKTLNPPAPGPFQKTTPFNGASGLPADTAQVQLAWTAASDADGYEVCFGTQVGTCDLSGGGFQDVGFVTSRLVSQLPFSVTLQPASAYWWQVRAYNNVTATRTFADGGVDFYFTTANVSGPGAFSKDAPVNGTFGMPTASLVLRWFPAVGALSYEVCVGTAVNSCDALPGNAWLNVGSALSMTVTDLQPAQDYWWQVRALSGNGTMAANDGLWWRFTTVNQNPPAEFSKHQPTHMATEVPTATAVLSWFVSTGATGYEVCVSTDSAPTSCEASGGWMNVGNLTQWTPASLTAGRTYWWQVRALGSGLPVQADGGQWWAFTTANDTVNGPGDFQKTAPLSGTVVTGSAVLSWTTVTSAVEYRVCVGTAWGLCDVVNNAAVTSTSYGLSGLQPGEYWWQVTAVDAQGDTTQADGGERWRLRSVEVLGSLGDLDNTETRKVASARAVEANDVLTYTIVLSNGGAAEVANVTVVDTLPVSVTLIEASPDYNQLDESGHMLAWSGLSVPPRSTRELTIVTRVGVGVNIGDVLMNVAQMFMGAETFERQAVTIVGGSVRLLDNADTRKQASASAVRPGDLLTYTITLSNSGELAVSSVVVTDTLPVSVTLVEATSGYTQSGQVLVWSGLTVPPQSTLVLTLVVQVEADAPVGLLLVNSVQVGAPDGVVERQSEPVAVSSGIQSLDNADTRKQASSSVVRPGEWLTYTLTLSNSDAALVGGVVVEDVLPLEATLVGATPGYVLNWDNGLLWSGLTVQPQSTLVLTVVVTAQPNAVVSEPYAMTNTLRVTALGGEITRTAAVEVQPWRAFVPIVWNPLTAENAPYHAFVPIVWNQPESP